MPWEYTEAERKGYTESSQSGKYSDKKWEEIRNYVLTQEPLCRRCFEKFNRIVPATIVDHIIPAEEAPELFYELSNLRPVCEPCHRYITNVTGKRTDPRNLAKGQKLMDDLESE